MLSKLKPVDDFGMPATLIPTPTYSKPMKSASKIVRPVTSLKASTENVSQMLSKLKPMDNSKMPATLISTPTKPMNSNLIDFKSMSPIPLKSLMPKPSTPLLTPMPKSVKPMPLKTIPQQTFNVMPVLANLKPMKLKDSKAWTLESV